MSARRAVWRRFGVACLCGLLWGAAVTAMETLSEPMQALPLADLLALIGSIAWTWVVSGLWWALIAVPLASLSVRRLTLLIPPLALVVAFVHRATWMIGLTFSLQGGSSELMGANPQPDAIFFHVLWANLFYGGLYLLGFAGYHRVWRSRAVLAELASSRAEVDAIQHQERLRALRGQLQPGIVVEALTALQASYKSARAPANVLFDELVLFLRAAMPAVRARSATLDSELVLVRHYAELRRHIGIGGGAAVRDLADPAADSLFPPFCLLPLIEELGCDAAPNPLEICRFGGRDWTGVRLDIPCNGQRPAVSEAERRMRLDLAALYGTQAQFTVSHDAGWTRVMLRIPTAISGAPVARRLAQEYFP